MPVQSGYFPTPTSTPTGAPKKIAVNNPYVSKDEFINSSEAMGLGLTASSIQYTSGELDRKLLQASSFVNRYCNRYFDTQTIDETHTGFYVRPYNPQMVSVTVANSPYQSINRLWIYVLKWFIEVDITSPASYMQDFPDYGYFRIVPLLSSAGTGTGSPIPAAILDKVALGVLWINYTFGYGSPQTGMVVPATDASYKTYQLPVGYRLWAPDQTTNVYKNGALVPSANYTIDYPNGMITFSSANVITDVITADFVTNESIPSDIKDATILVASHLIGQALQNPIGANSYSIQTYSVSFGNESSVIKRAKEILDPFVDKMPKII